MDDEIVQEKSNRSFIVDFGCCLPFGHNLQSVNLYRKKEENRGQDAIAIVCKRISYMKSDTYNNFDFLLPGIYKNLIANTIDNKIFRTYFWALAILVRLPFLSHRYSIALYQAKQAIKKFNKKYKLSKNDFIIFPSADYYGIRAFLEFIKTLDREEIPKLHIRFIGVLEFTHVPFHNSLNDLIRLINDNDKVISVSAEIPLYARYLNEVLPNISVIAEPYPILDRDETKAIKQKKYSKDGEFVIFLPGTNRVDKGYFDLFNIIKELFYQFPNIKFIVQDMKQTDNNFKKSYQKKLAKLPNIELIEAVQPRERIEALYDEANLIFLPYDPSVYYYRGSAIHYEALINGIPVLARKGCGFVEEIMSWSSGWIYSTKQDLFSCIEEIINTDQSDIEKKMDKALNNFGESSNEATNFYMS